jgi:hypothetical protein
VIIGLLGYLYYRRTGNNWWLIAIIIPGMLGPLTRELPASLAAILLVLVVLSKKRNHKLALVAAILAFHAVFPIFLPSLILGDRLDLYALFGQGMSRGLLVQEEGAGLIIHFDLPLRAALYFSPLAIILAFLSMALFYFNRRERFANLVSAAILFILVISLTSIYFPEIPVLSIIAPVLFTLAICVPSYQRYGLFLPAMFVIPILPFLFIPVYDVWVRLPALAFIIMALLWIIRLPEEISAAANMQAPSSLGWLKSLARVKSVKLPVALIAVLILLQLPNLAASEITNRKFIETHKEIADWLTQNVPQGSALVSNLRQDFDIDWYSDQHVTAYYAPFTPEELPPLGPMPGGRGEPVLGVLDRLATYPDTPVYFIINETFDRFGLPVLPDSELKRVKSFGVDYNYLTLDPFETLLPKHYVTFYGPTDLGFQQKITTGFKTNVQCTLDIYQFTGGYDSFRHAYEQVPAASAHVPRPWGRYLGFNIVADGSMLYGISGRDGGYEQERIKIGAYSFIFTGQNMADVKNKIDNYSHQEAPIIIVDNYRGITILGAYGTTYGIPADEVEPGDYERDLLPEIILDNIKRGKYSVTLIGETIKDIINTVNTEPRFVNFPNLLVTNPDFETGSPLEGWNVFDCKIKRDDNQVKMGEYSLKIVANKVDIILSQPNLLTANPGFEMGSLQERWGTFDSQIRLESTTVKTGEHSLKLTADKEDPAVLFDNLLHRNPDFEIGNSARWWHTFDSKIKQDSTIAKTGKRSLKITADKTIFGDAGASQNVFKPEYRGQTFTFGAWVMAPSTNDKSQTLGIWDGVSVIYSPPIPHDGQWHWITVTKTLDESATELRVYGYVLTGSDPDNDDVLYMDSCLLFEGDAPPSNAGATQNVFKPEYRGQTFIFGAWVMAPSSNDKIQILGIWDGVRMKYSQPIPHDGKWHWITVTKTLDESATELRVYGYVLTGSDPDKDDVLYLDSATLISNLLTTNTDFETGDLLQGWDTFDSEIEHEDSLIKNGEHSLKVTASKSTPGDAGASQNVFKSHYPGQTFTFGAWVMAPSSNDKTQTLGIWDGVSVKYSEPIPHDDQWHWVTVTKVLDKDATELRTYGYVLAASDPDKDDVLYMDSVGLFEGGNPLVGAGASQNVFKSHYPGQTFTFGAWVMAPSSNNKTQTLGIWDGVSMKYSQPIPHDNQWHWVTVTKTLDENATELSAYGSVLIADDADSDDILYLGSAVLVPNLLTTNTDFEIGDPPEEWAFFDSRLKQDSAVAKTGKHSLKIMVDKTTFGDAGASQNIFQPEYRGRTFTFGAWVMAPSSNDKTQTLGIWDGVSVAYSPPIPHDGKWHWMTITQTLSDSATELRAYGYVLTANNPDKDDILYMDSAGLILGDYLPALPKVGLWE